MKLVKIIRKYNISALQKKSTLWGFGHSKNMRFPWTKRTMILIHHLNCVRRFGPFLEGKSIIAWFFLAPAPHTMLNACVIRDIMKNQKKSLAAFFHIKSFSCFMPPHPTQCWVGQWQVDEDARWLRTGHERIPPDSRYPWGKSPFFSNIVWGAGAQHCVGCGGIAWKQYRFHEKRCEKMIILITYGQIYIKSAPILNW